MRIIQPTTSKEFNRDQVRRTRRLESLLGAIARDAPFPSSQRPDPIAVGVGARIFDVDLGKPLWSNGTAWVDATGTPV